MPLIALLTDFGVKDEYVGVLKGVVLSVNPQASIVDLTHGIDPQDVRQAAGLLKSAYAYFPIGTIHVAIVDPGVGSERAILAARYGGHIFLAPDNGLISQLWGKGRPEELVRVDNPTLWRQPVSPTFHGRDIFAPVAAHLSLGMELAQLGSPLAWDQIAMLPEMDDATRDGVLITGRVIAVDHFGNLVTDIDAAQVASFDPRSLTITVGDHRIRGLSAHYAKGQSGGIMALIGSRQTVEIAVNGGRAAARLNATKGAVVCITLYKED